jgi:hypothetical protein
METNTETERKTEAMTFVEALKAWEVPAHIQPAISRHALMRVCGRINASRALVVSREHGPAINRVRVRVWVRKTGPAFEGGR